MDSDPRQELELGPELSTVRIRGPGRGRGSRTVCGWEIDQTGELRLWVGVGFGAETRGGLGKRQGSRTRAVVTTKDTGGEIVARETLVGPGPSTPAPSAGQPTVVVGVVVT